MTDPRLVLPADIDDGSLDHLPPQAVFIMGVEWCEFRRRLLGGAAFSMVVHPDNAYRVAVLCEQEGRYNESHDLPDEPGVVVMVGACGA